MNRDFHTIGNLKGLILVHTFNVADVYKRIT